MSSLDVNPSSGAEMTALDSQRNTALSAIDRQQNLAKAALLAGAAIEALLLVALLMTIDLKDHTQRIIFLSAMLVYLPLAAGLMAIAALINRQARSVLYALQTMSEGRR